MLAELNTDTTLGDLTDSYGESLESGVDALADSVDKTEVENTTSVSYVLPEAARTVLFEDRIIEQQVDRDLKDILRQNGVTETDAERLVPMIAGIIEGADAPLAGSVVALRLAAAGPDQKHLMQLSYYKPDGYAGSIAQNRAGVVLPASDPWIDDKLLVLAQSGESEEAEPSNDGRYRLLDALYSASARNGVPTTLVGEIVAMMSKAHDLDQFAKLGDKVTLVYAKEHGPNGQLSGQIMYVSIKGPSASMDCYVVPDRTEGGFKCFDPGRGLAAPGSAFISPVKGILTSKFGPRKHPIHKIVRLHAGVDWAAPTGTPVHAAAAGKISLAGDGQGYGNLVVISHPGGLETRYAHLNKFAPAAKAGNVVQAGEVIGYVGTTGNSTGPHLHFETRQSGEPVDPMPLLSGGQVVAGSNAVEALVAQIIKVESAGNPNAKNTRSTATGLGQFISSTWIRMMNTYRPDLVATMSTQDLLNLRRDPTLSREMVKKLAQENENYLASRRHQITAGRLYLAHFLGPEGANRVLSAPDGQAILDLMGAGVVNANPFLAKYTVADLKSWSDRKMHGRGAAPTAPVAAPVPPEIQVYQQLVDDVLKEVG
jgi:murein DD-endopeptidase MepM/ murein hydrolase activator NlpD